MKGEKRKGGEKKKETEKKVGKKKAPSGNRTSDLLICSRHYSTELPPQGLIANCTYVCTIYRKSRF